MLYNTAVAVDKYFIFAYNFKNWLLFYFRRPKKYSINF